MLISNNVVVVRVGLDDPDRLKCAELAKEYATTILKDDTWEYWIFENDFCYKSFVNLVFGSDTQEYFLSR